MGIKTFLGLDNTDNKDTQKYGKEYLKHINFYTSNVRKITAVKQIEKIFESLSSGIKVETINVLDTIKKVFEKLNKYFKIDFKDINERKPKNVRESMYRMYPDEYWDWIPEDVVDSRELLKNKQTRKYIFEHYDSLKFNFLNYNVRTDYQNMKFQKKNRAIDPVAVIVDLVIVYFWGIFKMVVSITSDNIIQDGQHRVIAMFIIGMPILFNINDELTPDLVTALNIGTNKMTNDDKLTSRINDGVVNAVRFQESTKVTGSLNIDINDDGVKVKDSVKNDYYKTYSKMMTCFIVTGKLINYDIFVDDLFKCPDNYDDSANYEHRLKCAKDVINLLEETDFYNQIEGFGVRKWTIDAKYIPCFLIRIYCTGEYTLDEMKQIILCLKTSNKTVVNNDSESSDRGDFVDTLVLPNDEPECIKNMVRPYYLYIFNSDRDKAQERVYAFSNKYKSYWASYKLYIGRGREKSKLKSQKTKSKSTKSKSTKSKSTTNTVSVNLNFN